MWGWIFWGTDFCLGEFCWVNFGNWLIHSVRSGLFVANRRPCLINSMWKNHSGSVLFCYSSLWLLLRQNIPKYIHNTLRYPSKHPMKLGVCYACWWLNQPLWKIWVKMGSSSPNRDEHQKNIWNHHLVWYAIKSVQSYSPKPQWGAWNVTT